MSTQRDRLRDDVHFRVLRRLEQDPQMSQRDLAKALGISTGGVHYVLTALVEKGLLKLSKFTAAPDKRRYAYRLTPHGVAERARLTRNFLSRKMAEYQALKAEIAEISADLVARDLEAHDPEARRTKATN
jgi:EPS-associated MarR family transcriptional regulator